MNNFKFQNPTKLIFGKGSISKLSKEIPTDKHIMITFGGGSVKKNGVYQQVIEALKNHNFIEFWGIESNPKVETLRKAIALGKENNIDFLLSVGGGSVLDGTKLIAAAIPYQGDAWELVLDNSKVGQIVPFADVITLPATGSEMNSGSVISSIETQEKYPFYSTFPTFSILDPEVTFTLPKYQLACGLADSYIHVMEQYLVDSSRSPLMDRWAEGLLLTIKEIAPKVLFDNPSYETMSDFMLCATMALNGFIAMGVKQDWATHMIGHEITALTGITHGETLVIVEPALMKVMKHEKQNKLLQYAQRVWGITDQNQEKAIDEVIAQTEKFYQSLGLRTKLSQCNVGEEVINEIVSRFQKRGVRLGENASVDYNKVKEILTLCK